MDGDRHNACLVTCEMPGTDHDVAPQKAPRICMRRGAAGSDPASLIFVQPDRDLHAQFPLGCRVIQRLTKGSTNKVVAFTARWRSNTGNHLLVSAQRAKEYFGAAPGGVRNVR